MNAATVGTHVESVEPEVAGHEAPQQILATSASEAHQIRSLDQHGPSAASATEATSAAIG